MTEFVQPSISDYALIGNGRSAALVSKSGSIDWLCWPRFDSPSILGRLLDPETGYWSIEPAGQHKPNRRYMENSNVLEISFQTQTGVMRLVDAMPIEPPDSQRMTPEHELLRIADCIQGEVVFKMVFAPRPGYGRNRPVLKQRTPMGVAVSWKGGFALLRSSHSISIAPGRNEAWMECKLREGESAHFSLVFSSESPAVMPALGEEANRRMRETVVQWEKWANQAQYNGPFRGQVLRSALVLKSLLFAPSGAVVAAPTTSLPERIGGDLNWDYRFCWLRDASLTMRALTGLGYHEEAMAFLGWLLHTTRLSRPKLKVLYDVYGRPTQREKVLGHLNGYCNSRPVRVGNAAWNQLQLDIYGELIDAATRIFRLSRRKVDSETAAMLIEFGRYVAANWHLPDEGVWEPRQPRSVHTHSLLLCWTALDRLCALHTVLPPRKGKFVSLFKAEREKIREAIERDAWSAKLGSYTQSPGRATLDATSYLLSWFGFEPATSQRMRSTFKTLERALVTKEDLVFRYERSFAKSEGAFGICCFWRIGYLALAGRKQEAERAFSKLARLANDVGLFGEEIDTESGEALGNFPQAFTHIGLINAALTLWPNATKSGGAKA